jgi:peptidoglycan/xylan/chitin deacetylase (PgdA/CDA1 family)
MSSLERSRPAPRRVPATRPPGGRGPGWIAVALLAAAVLAPALACRLPPSAKPQPGPRRELAITFDDLPFVPADLPVAELRHHTDRLLRGLDGAPVVGFVNEGKLEVDGELDPERVALLERWLAAGAELGNHTFGHLSLHSVPVGAYERDILRGERVLRPLLARTGRPLEYFRHPFLRTGRDLETRDRVHAFLARHGYRVAPVTVDNSDWIFARAYHRALESGAAGEAEAQRLAAEYVSYMVRKLDYWERQSAALLGREIRQVLLLHANEINADHLPGLLAAIEARGYRLVTLERALADPAYRSIDTFTGDAGISWIHRWLLSQGKRPLPDEPRAAEWVLRAAGVDAE